MLPEASMDNLKTEQYIRETENKFINYTRFLSQHTDAISRQIRHDPTNPVTSMLCQSCAIDELKGRAHRLLWGWRLLILSDAVAENMNVRASLTANLEKGLLSSTRRECYHRHDILHLALLRIYRIFITLR